MGLHSCEYYSNEFLIPNKGGSVSSCSESKDGRFWVNGCEDVGFYSQVNYCPFCGERAPVQFDPANPDREFLESIKDSKYFYEL